MLVVIGLLNAAALMRVIALAVSSVDPSAMLLASGTLWIGAFALFVYIYAPILIRPRVDGQAG